MDFYEQEPVVDESGTQTSSGTMGNFQRISEALRTNQRYADKAAFFAGTRSFHIKLFAAVPAALVLGSIVAWLGLATALQIATLGGIALIGYRFWKQEPISLKAVVIFIIGVAAVYLAAVVLRSRLWAAVAIAVVTIAIFETRGKRPLFFFSEYLLADSVFTPEMRSKIAAGSLRHSRVTLGLLLAVVVFVPWLHSTSFAVLMVCLLCLAIIFLHVARTGDPKGSLVRAVRACRFVLFEYLTYPDVPSPARSWAAPEACASRRRTFTTLWASLALMLIVGLSYCIPWEFFASHFQSGFFWSMPPPSTASSHSWLLAPLSMAFSAKGDYRWAIGIGAVLSFVLPYLILFTLYLPSLQKCLAAMHVVETLRAADPRTEYERRVDRTMGAETVEG